MAFDIDGALKAGYSPEEISQHLKFDYKGAIASGYSDEEVLSHLSGLNKKEESSIKVPQPLKDAFGGLESVARMVPNLPSMAYGAGIDAVGKFMVPKELRKDYDELAAEATDKFPHVPALTESGAVADEMLGQGFKTVVRAPGAAIGGAISGGGQVEAQRQMNDPHALLPNITEVAGNVAGIVGGARAVPEQVRGLANFKLKKETTGDPKLDAAKAESEMRRQGEQAKKEAATPIEYDPGFSEGNISKEPTPLAIPPVEFPLEPKTPTRPLYNEIDGLSQGSQIGKEGEVIGKQFGGRDAKPWDTPEEARAISETPLEIRNVDHVDLGKEIDESGVRNPYLQGDRNANVEVDSVSGRPIFPEDTLSTSKKIIDETSGTEVAGAYVRGIDGYYLNPDYISRLWLNLKDTTKEKLGLRTAEDLQNFVELHERQHWSDFREMGDLVKPGETMNQAEKRINNLVKEQYDPFNKVDTPPVEAYAGERHPYFPTEVSLREYAEGLGGKPKGLTSPETISPAQLRARLEKNLKSQESVLKRLQEAENTGDTLSKIGELQKKKAVLESVIETQTAGIESGKKAGISFEPKTKRKLGGVGKKGNKQGGSVNFGIQELVSTLWDFAERIPDSPISKKITEAFKRNDIPTLWELSKEARAFTVNSYQEAKALFGQKGRFWVNREGKYQKVEGEHADQAVREYPQSGKYAAEDALRAKVLDGYVRISGEMIDHNGALNHKQTEAISDYMRSRPEKQEFVLYNYETGKYTHQRNPFYTHSMGGVGKKQGGAWTPFAKSEPSLKKFADHLERDVSDPVVKELYNKYYGKEIKDPTPQEIAISKIPGLKETISPELQPLETMMERWKTETDISSNPSARALRENLSSGGRMTAARTGNSFIDWNVENILGETRKAQVVIKTIQNKLRGEVNKITGGLMAELRGKSEGVQIFIEAMNAMLKAEGKEGLPQGISPEASKLATTLRSSLDDLGRKIQAELTAQGIEGFKWRPNYLAGVFFGPYRSLVKDATGKTIGVVAGRTKAEATAALDFIKDKMPDVTFDLVEYNPKWDQGPGSLGARYGKASEVLELLKNQDESAQLLQENLSAYYTKVQDNYMGYKQHFKKKTGVFGSEGSRPWENARNNAFDLLEAQLGIIDHGYHWLAEQKIMKDMDRILTDSTIELPESKRYVTQYLDHAFGRTEDMVKVFSKAQDQAAQMLGIAPSAFREMSSILRNTALTGTLGVSGGFVLTQFVQVPQALAVGFGRAMDAGVRGGSRTGSAMIGGMDLIHGINGKFENMTVEGRYFFDYFTKNGIMDPHLVEHTIHRKIVSTTGMTPIQKAIWGSVNGAFKGAEGVSGLIGKFSIERPEAWTRGTFAMTMAHYYKSAGYSLKEAAIRADKDTSVLFVDYSSQERAMAFQRLGELGKFASTVSTFKMNSLNQWFTFSNKKMYTALAVLALTSWFTTGMFGMPFGDEAEFGATFLKSKGIDIQTPREWMLREAPEWLSFGPLSSFPRWIGEAVGNPNVPSAALHRKFSQDNVIPDDLASFIYPLMSFYTNKIKTGSDWVKSGFAKQEGAVFARELVPGNLKYGVDYLGLTNEKGLTIDPNQIHDVKPDHYNRTKQEWKLAAALGVVSQREFANKQTKQLDKMSEMAWKESTKSKVAATISAFDNKDREKFELLATQAIKYNPGAAEEIVKYINGRAEANNIPMDKLMEIQFAKGATSPHGVERLQGFQQFQRNR